MKFNVIDLFCGIGGFSSGFKMAGFNIVLGIDNWKIALDTFQKNHKNTIIINRNIENISDVDYLKYKNKIDVIIGGPPCQGFSMSGKRDINDKRNTLFEEMIRAVKIIKPKVVILENVVGLLSMKNLENMYIKEIIIQKFKEIGYYTEYRILDASNYGVPQARKRVVFIASRIGKIDFPKPLKTRVTVYEALSNIPDINTNKYLEPKSNFQIKMADGEIIIYNHEGMNHNNKVLKRISLVPPGGNWKDIPKEYYDVKGEHSNNYKRLDPNKPSITLKHATKSMIIHPKYDRVLTAREVARLQSFSDSFILSGTRFEQHQQLANAVPPLLAYEIAKEIIKKLEEKYE